MAIFLFPFSLIYFIVSGLRNLLYSAGIFRRYRLGAKVVSVGNITWGGTGKTPVVAFIAGLLSKKNCSSAILIRGYGNDESELLPKLTANIPVLVGRDRVKNGREVVDKHLAETIILDDGFQYRRLVRDLDIVCIDAARPFGNGWVIPAGSLREGIAGLKRADIFLITKADLVSGTGKLEGLEKKLKSVNRKAVIAKAIHRPLFFYKLSNIVGDGLKPSPTNEEKVTIGELQNREIVLVSAIGSPESFEKTILRLGLKINRHFIFRDHHNYTKNDMAHIEHYCEENKLGIIITTEKDAVKLRKLKEFSGVIASPEQGEGRSNLSDKEIASSSATKGGGTPRNDIRGKSQLLVLKVRLEIIENEDGFCNRLFGIYNS